MNYSLYLPLLFLLGFCWISILWSKIGYYVYLWQIKGYRFDRLYAALKEPKGWKIIFNASFFLKIFLLILYPFALRLVNRKPSLSWLLLLFFLFYGLELIRIIKKGVASRLPLPILTMKSATLFSASLFVSCAGLFSFFTFRSSPYTGNVFLVYEVLLIIDILIPFIVSFFVILLKPASYLAKKRIVARAKKKRAVFHNLTAIGITGSFGKTSVKEFLAHILSAAYKTVKTKEHQNTEIGAARAILGMREDAQLFVAEMGAYRKGDVEEISQVVKPTIGIITAIGPQHLALFGSIKTIIETKFELAKALPENGVLIVNWDNEYINAKCKMQNAKSQLKIKKYSIDDENADVYASDVREYRESLEFMVHHKNEKENFMVNVLGKHNISNILAATAAALECGMTLKEIASAAKTITPFPRAMSLHWGEGNIPIIDDSYNASIDGVKAALNYMALYKDKKRILIMPSLIELGEKAFLYHEELAKEIAQSVDYAFITDTKYREAFWRGWVSIKHNNKGLSFENDPRRLIEKIKQVIDEKSVILLEGRAPKELAEFLLHHVL